MHYFFSVIKMENGTKKIGLRIAGGFLVGILIIVAVVASGVTLPSLENIPSLGNEQGRLTVLLKDAPIDLDSLMITITDLEIHKIGTGEGNGGEWIDLMPEDEGNDPDPIGPFDLLTLQGENTLTMFDGLLFEGTYNKIRMYVSEAIAYYTEAYKTESGRVDGAVNVPPSKIDVITEFELFEGGSKVVLIDMEPDWVAINKNNQLRPVLKATISEQNPPVADFTYDPEDPIIDQTITFDASISRDIDGTISTYNWDFGDGTMTSGVTVDHSYSAAGTFTVTLIVTDNDGYSDTKEQEITIPSPLT